MIDAVVFAIRVHDIVVVPRGLAKFARSQSCPTWPENRAWARSFPFRRAATPSGTGWARSAAAGREIRGALPWLSCNSSRARVMPTNSSRRSSSSCFRIVSRLRFVRQQSVLDRDDEHHRKLQSLGSVQRHHRHPVVVRLQASVSLTRAGLFQKRLQRRVARRCARRIAGPRSTVPRYWPAVPGPLPLRSLAGTACSRLSLSTWPKISSTGAAADQGQSDRRATTNLATATAARLFSDSIMPDSRAASNSDSRTTGGMICQRG